MNPFIHTVTVTGADDSVRPEDLLRISREYPFVEFGILLSRSSIGRHRFPSAEWINEARDALNGSGVRCSGHICGQWVWDVLAGRNPHMGGLGIKPGFADLFQRFQLNTHGIQHDWDEEGLQKALPAMLVGDKELILQYDKKHDDLALWAVAHGFNVSALFDLSHGSGALPEKWERPSVDCPAGYAGGLSPDNVAAIVPLIGEANGWAPAWIDAETHLRSDNDRLFDVGKVLAFLDAASPWVMESKLGKARGM